MNLEIVCALQQQQLPRYRRFCSTCQKLAAALAVGAALAPNPSLAQMPSFDDYNAGSGSVVRSDKASGNVEMAKTIMNSVSTTKKAATLPLYIKETLPQYLETVKELARQGLWKDIIAVDKAPFRIAADSGDGDNSKSSRLIILKKKYFGGPNTDYLVDALKISSKTAVELESIREDVAFTMGQVDDVAVSNAVSFFNKDDLTQVKRIINNAEEEEDSSLEDKTRQVNDIERFKGAVTEALDLCKDAEVGFKKMANFF